MSLTAIRKTISRYEQRRWTRLNNPKLLRRSIKDAIAVDMGGHVEVLLPLDLIRSKDACHLN